MLPNSDKQQDAIQAINRANSAYDSAALHFNSIQDSTFEHLIAFYNRVGLISAGIISLSIGFLPSLKEQNGLIINHYKILFLIGLLFLFLSLLTGFGYRFFITKSSWHAALKNVADKLHNKAITENKAIKDGFAYTVDGKDFSDHVENWNRIHNEKNAEFEKYNFLARLCTWICPLTFFLGIVFITLYFSAQIFDF